MLFRFLQTSRVAARNARREGAGRQPTFRGGERGNVACARPRGTSASPTGVSIMARETCSHDSCTCPVEAGADYCSESCRTSHSAACECGHPDCQGVETATE